MIQRYPARKNEVLQAFDAADELLLAQARKLDLTGKKIVVINDAFGALVCGLKEFAPESYTDSYSSAKGLSLNSGSLLKSFSSLDEFQGPYDLALIKIPKNMGFFEDELSRLTDVLQVESQVICGYMIKHQSKASFDLLNQIVGVTTTSLAQKKARLIFCRFEKAKRESPFPIEVKLDGFEKSFHQESNLFSRDRLDIGTRFFLEHLPKGGATRILDLGCANGVVGIRAKQQNPSAQLSFTDDSQMAIRSAKINFARYFEKQEAEFDWSHCYETGAHSDFDWVLCNPPFHHGHQMGEQIAREMFIKAKQVLKLGGRLRIVGNAHLQYAGALKRIFGNAEIIAQNAKFQVVESLHE